MWIKKIPGIAVNVAVLILNVFAILMIVGLFLHRGTTGARVNETKKQGNYSEPHLDSAYAASRCGLSPYEIPEKTAHSCKHDSQFFLPFRMALNNYQIKRKR